MTSTSIFRSSLAALTCLFVLSGCDALGPEGGKTGPTVFETSLPDGYLQMPDSVSPDQECDVLVVTGARVSEWHVSRHLKLVSTDGNTARIRTYPETNDRARVLAITEGGRRITKVFSIKEGSPAC